MYSLEVLIAWTASVRHDVVKVLLYRVERTVPTCGATCRRLAAHCLVHTVVQGRGVGRVVAVLSGPRAVDGLTRFSLFFRIAVCPRTTGDVLE